MLSLVLRGLTQYFVGFGFNKDAFSRQVDARAQRVLYLIFGEHEKFFIFVNAKENERQTDNHLKEKNIVPGGKGLYDGRKNVSEKNLLKTIRRAPR